MKRQSEDETLKKVEKEGDKGVQKERGEKKGRRRREEEEKRVRRREWGEN